MGKYGENSEKGRSVELKKKKKQKQHNAFATTLYQNYRK